MTPFQHLIIYSKGLLEILTESTWNKENNQSSKIAQLMKHCMVQFQFHRSILDDFTSKMLKRY